MQLIDNRVVDLVGQAMKQGHEITPCPACGGPLVHSLADSANALCLRCGHRTGEPGRRCWTCGAAIPTPQLPADLALGSANGRADLTALSVYATCSACGGQATAAQARRSVRHCTVCNAPLSGKPRGRALDLCEACRQNRFRQQKRVYMRNRRRSGSGKIAP